MTDFNEQDIERLSAYLDGMLPEAERLEVEALLQSVDSPYQAELASLENTIKLVKGLPPLKAPRSFALTREMVGLPVVQAQPSRRTKQINFYAMSFLSAAASFIMVILAVVMWTSNTARPSSDVGTVASAPTIVILQSEEQEIQQQAIEEIMPASALDSIEQEPTSSTQLDGDSESSSGTLLGSAIGQTALPTIDPAMDAPIGGSEVSAYASIEAGSPEEPMLNAPAPFPEMLEEAPYLADAEENLDLQEAEEQATNTDIGLMRSLPPTDEVMEEAIMSSMPADTSGEVTPNMENTMPIEGSVVVQEVKIAVEESQPTTDEQSGLPAVAVVFLILGGLFAVMAITGIYWARKVRA